MIIELDGKGNPFITVGNLRITYVEGKKREEGKDWAGMSVLRIQAYKDDPNNACPLFMGPEYPVRDHKEACRLIAAISYLLAEKMWES
jgi:hypothetical protein